MSTQNIRFAVLNPSEVQENLQITSHAQSETFQTQTATNSAVISLALIDFTMVVTLATILTAFVATPLSNLILMCSTLFYVASLCVSLYDLHDKHYTCAKLLPAYLLIFVLGLHELSFGNLAWFQLIEYSLIVGSTYFAACFLHYVIAKPFSLPNPTSKYCKMEKAMKRVMDVCLTSLALIPLTPILGMICLLIWVEDKGNPLFIQRRGGYKDSVFTIFKFRTMYTNVSEKSRRDILKHSLKNKVTSIFAMKADPRVTRIGKALRITNIDEIPQLFNVLKGEMSLVGPRPLMLEESIPMMKHCPERALVHPGLTGLWQVEGRSRGEREFHQVASYDREYVRNWSLTGDIIIIFRTIRILVKLEGSYTA